ncbi:MAG: hypothetical protein K0S24_4893 [Sphingobacterium sp.]|jgi:hypothetical protein|nr:hypothetical protein [Sphingobacterium sp.]
MVLNAGKISVSELLEIDANQVTAVTIECTLEKEKAEIIKRILQLNEDIGVIFVLDPAANKGPESFQNTGVLNILGNIKHIALLAFGSEQLAGLEMLDGLSCLESFRLQGNYKKNIDLRPIVNCTGIKSLELEYGISGAQQEKFVSSLPLLESLKASVVDLAKINPNPELEQLTITDTLKSPELLASIFRRLKMLTLSKAKGIDSFDFISSLKGLESLQIGHTSKLISLPKMGDPLILRSLHLVATKQFADMESILQFKQLEELKITEPTRVEQSEFIKLKDIRSLKKVYAVFQTETEDIAFRQMAEETGWEF